MSVEPVHDQGWREERRKGVGAIAISLVICAVLWISIAGFAPPIAGMESLEARMLFALKCVIVATLFCLLTGVEAVAHERLQSAAFDPLEKVETRRLQINQRYLQNTLEQIVIFAVGLFGLAAYSPNGEAMRAVLATTIVWILARFAFWIGYHRSAAMRGLGAPGMLIGLLVLLYVGWRIGDDVAGPTGGWAIVAAYLLVEVILFRATRERA